MLILFPKLFVMLEFQENDESDFWVAPLKIFVIVNSSFALEILISLGYFKDFFFKYYNNLCLSYQAGMNMSPVSRLKKTWAKVKTAKFYILEVSLANIWSCGC